MEEVEEVGVLGPRVEQRSGLMEMQTLQEVSEELEARVAAGQEELREEREKVRRLERSFNQLALNHRGIVVFKDEYKKHNAQLLEQNKLLRTENQELFSHQLRDQETIICQLRQEVHLNEKKHEDMEKYLR